MVIRIRFTRELFIGDFIFKKLDLLLLHTIKYCYFFFTVKCPHTLPILINIFNSNHMFAYNEMDSIIAVK